MGELNTAVVEAVDAIVVGSGISGGWAAKELSEQGLQVLMLERGKPQIGRASCRERV